MLPTNAINSSASSILPSKEASLTLRLGQTVNFTLISQSKNFAVINIGGNRFTSQINAPLPENRHLQATVTQLKPEVKLDIKPSANQQSQNLLSQTLKNLLPAQTPIKNEIQQLLNLQTSGKLPVAIQSQLTSLMSTLLKISPTINGSDVRSAFANSGLFFENRLSNDKSTKKDFKANLLKLIGKLETAKKNTATSETSQLHKSAKQLLNKVTIQQIQAIESQAINLNLPLLDNSSSISLKVDIRKKQFEDDTIWEIITNLNLSLGKMSTKSIFAKEELTFQVWADSSSFLDKIKDNLDIFKGLLEQNGINYKNIFFLEKPPEVDTKAKKIALIDIKV